MKEFSAKVSDEEYEKFKAAFPQYGAVNWFINSSLEEFNRQVEANPALRRLVDKSIAMMLSERRTEGDARIQNAASPADRETSR